MTDHGAFVLINTYCPRYDEDNPSRGTYKQLYNRTLLMRCEALHAAGRQVVLVGDLNVSHKHIDHCDPYPEFETLPSRIWMDQFVLAVTRQPIAVTSAAIPATSSVEGDQQIRTEGGVDEAAEIELERLQTDQAILDMLNEPFSQDNGVSQSNQVEQANEDASLEPAEQPKLISTPFLIDLFRYFQPTRKQAFTCWYE